ncbi:MAG: hypothetical protein C4521_09515 [Actinobacteria bacterium]|nr:MAG: hypothetical protein C4521_09515 [Actinomycetota bacterium]
MLDLVQRQRLHSRLGLFILLATLSLTSHASAATKDVTVNKAARAEMVLAPGDFAPPTRLLAPARMPSFESTPDPSSPETFDTLDQAGGAWYMTATNELGQYAWGESYVLAAYVMMYEATGETRYLDKFVEHANAVSAATDAARGVKDYRGKTLGAWRCGGIYTISARNLAGRTGKPVIKVLGTNWHSNNYTQVSVLPGSSWRRFTLAVKHPYSSKAEVYRDLSVNPRSPDYFARRVNGVSGRIRLRGLVSGAREGFDNPVATGYVALSPLKYHFAVHTGLIAYPLARFARLVGSNPVLDPAYGAAARRYLDTAEQALLAHNDEYVDAGSYAYYRFRRGAPVWADGVELPHNQNLAMARLILELYRAKQALEGVSVDGYKQRASKLSANFKRHLALDPNNAYSWHYWWGKGVSGWSPSNSPSMYTPSFAGGARSDDLPHAAISVDFVHEAVATGIGGWGRAHLIRFANTFHANMTRDDGSLALYVHGYGQPALDDLVGAGGWLGLSDCSRNVFQTANRSLAQSTNLAVLQPELFFGVAYSNLEGGNLGVEPMMAPTVTPPPAPASNYVRGSFDVTLDASADATPSVDFFVDGVRVSSASAPPFTGTFNTTTLSDGKHTFRAVARDGEWRTRAALVPLVVDNTRPVTKLGGPTLSPISPNRDGYAEWTSFRFWSSERSAVTVRLKHVATGKVFVPAYDSFWMKGGRSWKWNGRAGDGASLPDGAYLLYLSSTDVAGNRGRTMTAKVTLNNTLHRVLPASKVFRRGRRVLVSYNVRHPATVSWWIAGPGGRLVAKCARPSRKLAGAHTMWWNQRDRSGRAVPRGTYRIILTANNVYGPVRVVARVGIL